MTKGMTGADPSDKLLASWSYYGNTLARWNWMLTNLP
jgi:hypothetical protein